VTSRTAAARYARALFDVALKEKADLSRAETELAEFLTLLDQDKTLSKALLNPAVPAPRKRSVVTALTARMRPQEVVGKLLALLAERDRLKLLPELIAAYRDRVLGYQKVVRAEVVTTEPLAPERASRIERSLAQVTGRTVTLSARVDPSIIGGVVARVGDTVYDGSIARQLAKMRERLIEGTRGEGTHNPTKA
jgi:F-type H+-transporting ATPase subunit delta